MFSARGVYDDLFHPLQLLRLINHLSAGQLGAGDVLQGFEVRDRAVARRR